MVGPMIRLLALMGAATISFSAILVRLADLSPSTTAFFRPAYALPPLLALALATRSWRAPRLRSRLLAVLGGALMGASFTTWNYAIAGIGAGAATVLGNTQVVLVGLFAWSIFGERPSRSNLLAVPLVFVGVALTSGLGRPGAYGDAPVAGALWGLANAAFYTSFLLIFRRVEGGRGFAAGPLFDASLGAAAASLLAGVATDPRFSLVPSWPAHGWLLLLAAGPQTLGWLLILTALPRLPALDTSIILLLQPVLTVLWGRLIFQERLSALQTAGVVLVLGGVLAVNLGAVLRARGRARRAPSAVPDAVSRPPDGPQRAAPGTAPTLPWTA